MHNRESPNMNRNNNSRDYNNTPQNYHNNHRSNIDSEKGIPDRGSHHHHVDYPERYQGTDNQNFDDDVMPSVDIDVRCSSPDKELKLKLKLLDWRR